MLLGKRGLAGSIVFFSVCASSLGAERPAGITVDKDKRTVTIDAKIAPRKIDDPRYKEIYPIEVIACWAFPKGQKAHETVVTIDVKPSEVHKALESLGLKPGAPVMGESKKPPQGPEVRVYLEVPGADGQAKRLPIEKVLLDPKTNKPMPKVQWRFTGSALKQPNPDKDEKVYGADLTGTLISIFPVTSETVFQTNLTMKEEKYVKLETNKKLLPKEGTAVKLILEFREVTDAGHGFAFSRRENSIMLPRPFARLRQVCFGGLLVAAMGCSRSAVVVAPEGASNADEPPATSVVRAQDGEGDGASFSFPDDAGGVLLAKVLPPKETEAARIERTEPPRRSALSANLKTPVLPLPSSLAAMPRLPAPAKTAPLRPQLVIEETLDGLSDVPVLPQLQSLPDAGRIRVPSVNVNEPLALPILAHPVPDRASLDDPTAEASVEAALTASIPPRTTKAPFLKLSLPDPYDHRRPETSLGSPEQTEPPIGSPRTPTK